MIDDTAAFERHDPADDADRVDAGSDRPDRSRAAAPPAGGVRPDRRAPSRRLDRRVALVTGADRDPGRAIASLFAAEGARVVLMSAPGRVAPAPAHERRAPQDGAALEALERTRRAIEAAGGSARTVAGDPDGVECAFEAARRAIESWGAIDILVLDSTDRRGTDVAPIVRAVRPYLGRGASLTSLRRRDDGVGTLVEHASIRAARPGFARSALAELAREGVLADGAHDVAGRGAFARLPPGTTALHGFGRHVLALRDDDPRDVAACLLHLACADADWADARR